MPNALQQNNTPPPPPDINARPVPQSGAPGAPIQGPQPVPAPSHEETVAALRHFQGIERELITLAKNPGLGKTNVKSAVIEGVTKLVAGQYLTPSQAVIELSTVPEKPFDQKVWVQKHIVTTEAMQNAVLTHHQAANPGTMDWSTEGPRSVADPDNHAAALSGLMAQYKPSA